MPSPRVRLRDRWRDERGVALPLALMLLLSMSALALAFGSLASTEPTVASNHSRTAQARALAESGIERAAWALFNAAATGGIPDGQVPALAPYDGSSFFAAGVLGGFTVQVAAGTTATERTVVGVGWAPDNTSAAKAHRKIQAMLQFSTAGVRVFDPPCALCVAGHVQVGGNARVESRAGGCGAGVPPGSAVRSSGTVSVQGSGDVFGHGNEVHNEDGVDWLEGVPPASFTYTAAELAQLKAVARGRGTYYQGARTWLPATGIVFIDTVDGSDFDQDTPDSIAGSLTLAGTSTFSGIVIVAGSVQITGGTTINGLLYALNDLTAAGDVTINGAVATENRKDVSSTSVDTTTTGSVVINYDCDKVRNAGGTTPPVWTIKPGTYREIEGT